MGQAKTIRWLHLSDFHVGKDDYAQRGLFGHIVEHVAGRKEEGFVPDFIFVTGDLADKGQLSDYKTFWDDLGLPIQKVIGDGIEERTFVVPGNHDVDRARNPAFSRDFVASDESHYFDASEEGARLRKELLLPRFQALIDSDWTLLNEVMFKQEGSFTKVIAVRGALIGIIGINTAWLSQDEHDLGKLTPGKALLDEALKRVGKTDLKIVLGHHPLDWFSPMEKKRISSLLGNNAVIYLHGHLHEAWSEPNTGDGYRYLTLQSGAGFQARESEVWRNGLIWGDADLDRKTIQLQAWEWAPLHQEWALVGSAYPERFRDNDCWVYPLPSAPSLERVPAKNRTCTPTTPKGWVAYEPAELASHLAPLDENMAIQFFDGALPRWHTALSLSVPRREIVAKLVAHFVGAEETERSIVTVLLGAGCEGKTTALLQAAYQVVSGGPDWSILQRANDSAPVKYAEILPVLECGKRWIVIVDEADRVAKEVLTLLKELPRSLEGRVHCLIACRDSDWTTSGAHFLNWSGAFSFHTEYLSGLGNVDSKAIVEAWEKFGARGLGDLTHVSKDTRANALMKQAIEEAKTARGAFFGALLAVRHTSDLRAHATRMLQKLERRPIPGGATLKDALALVAVMHAEGLEYVSRPVLAQALTCPIEKLQGDVIAKLGHEAAATATSWFIFTRHRRIAKEIVAVLQEDFVEDTSEYFVALAKAAIAARNGGEHVPNIEEWRFGIVKHFFEADRQELAVRVARAVQSCEPQNYKTLVNLATLYRKTGDATAARGLFHSFPRSIKVSRGFYLEWGTSEGCCGNAAEDSMLTAFSLCDDSSESPVDLEAADRGLTGLCLSFRRLSEAYGSPQYRDALASVAVLGSEIARTQAITQYPEFLKWAESHGAKAPSPSEAIDLFKQCLFAIETQGIDPTIASTLPIASTFSFNGLARLVSDANETKPR